MQKFLLPLFIDSTCGFQRILQNAADKSTIEKFMNSCTNLNDHWLFQKKYNTYSLPLSVYICLSISLAPSLIHYLNLILTLIIDCVPWRQPDIFTFKNYDSILALYIAMYIVATVTATVTVIVSINSLIICLLSFQVQVQ